MGVLVTKVFGGIVIAYSSSKFNEKEKRYKEFLSHLTYNLGRVTTYVILGAILELWGGCLI